ncbi:MAG TPA: arginyltransferase [Thiotrichaceae bacterium]|nr:arginyltransferase [Thiotrichaceae bacterium]
MSNRRVFDVYMSQPYPCSYLPNRMATTVFVAPFVSKTSLLYNRLSQHGFRRSGNDIYSPHCEDCQACLAVRLPVKHFTPRRSQRRVWRKNQDLKVSAVAPTFEPEHFNLYSRYLADRHKDGGMTNPTPEEYIGFLTSTWSKTVFYEFRLEKQLVAIAVVDSVENGISAVYTFFDPNYSERSLGVYAILWEIEEAKRLNLEWLYLGYWVDECQKMSYKIEYQPLEYFYQGAWWPFDLKN